MMKAIFFDIDGTLVPFGERAPRPEILRALQRLQEQGIRLFVNTGRPKYIIDNLADYPFDGYVTMNGGLIELEGHLAEARPIPEATAFRVIEISDRHGFPCVAFAKDKMVINLENDLERQISSSINIHFDQIGDLRPLAAEGIYQFTVYITTEQQQRLYEPFLDGLVYPRWHPAFTDMDPAGTSKGLAIGTVASLLGIRIDETMAFGDGGNDLAMIEAAGIGIAMGNATEEVRAAAAFITDPVDREGILPALRHFGLLP